MRPQQSDYVSTKLSFSISNKLTACIWSYQCCGSLRLYS